MPINLPEPVVKPATEEKVYDTAWLERIMLQSPVNGTGTNARIHYLPARLTAEGYEVDRQNAKMLNKQFAFADFEDHGVDMDNLTRGQAMKLLGDCLYKLTGLELNS